jgi:hypothetical protein
VRGRSVVLSIAIALWSGGARASPVDHEDYTVLILNERQVSSDGRIDYQAWPHESFAFSEPVTVRKGAARRRYYPCRGLFYEVSTNEQFDEMMRRFYEDASAASDMAIVKGRVRYRGELLKYSTRVYGAGAVWGGNVLDHPLQAFRFGDYLIFLVKARMYFRENPYDLVLYNLKDGTYAIQETIGAWGTTFLFKKSEGVPDPRLGDGSR